MAEIFFDRMVAETGSGLRIAEAAGADGIKTGDPVTLGIRPEHVTFGNTLAGRVLNVERFGDSSLVYADCAEAKEPIVARAEGGTRLKRGDGVSFAFPAEHVHAFDARERALPRSVDPLSQ